MTPFQEHTVSYQQPPNTTSNKPGGGATPPPARQAASRAGAPSRLRLVPPGSPRRKQVTALGVAPVGKPVLIGLSPADARHHLHILGPTGTGKSTLLVNMVIGEARAGRGVAVFDPKGDLIQDVLDRLPAAAGKRLVLIDPDEKTAPVALNLFDLAADPETVADQLVGVMAKVWAQYWGPRTDDIARHAVLTLAHLGTATLSDVTTLLADTAYRRRVMATVRRRTNPVDWAGLAAFWAWYDGLSPALASVQIGPLLSKLRAVTSRRFAAQLFGTARSTFRLGDILDGGILLVRLPKGVLGDDTVRLTGSLLLAALLHAARARAGKPEAARLDASLIVDECHNFLNLPIGLDDALAEARGLRLSLVLAHQHLAQLAPRTAAAIDANARNKILFSLAPADARDLAHHVAPYFDPDDLTRRDAYGITCRLVLDGRDSEPFSLNTRPAPPVWPGRTGQLRAAARARGLTIADRDALAEARRLGPAAPGRPAKPTSDRADPTDTTGGGAAAPGRPAPQPPTPRPPDRGTHHGARPARPTSGLTGGTPQSTVTEQGRLRPGASPGALPGPSPVRDTPGEPPPATRPTKQVKPSVARTRGRGERS